MFVAYLIVTVLTAGANIFSATLDLIRYKQVSINMAKAGVPESWMTLLGVLKGAAAFGLLLASAFHSLGQLLLLA
jgi:DoxX-like protein